MELHDTEEAMGIRKIYDIRMKKNPQIFTDFHGVFRVQSATCTSTRKFHQWRR